MNDLIKITNIETLKVGDKITRIDSEDLRVYEVIAFDDKLHHYVYLIDVVTREPIRIYTGNINKPISISGEWYWGADAEFSVKRQIELMKLKVLRRESYLGTIRIGEKTIKFQ